MKNFLNEFKTFAMKGNMIDLAVGVVIGGAFSKIVTMIVDCIITPLISLVLSAITGQTSTEALFGELIVGPFPIGQLISTIIDFIITALVLFIIVKSINKLQSIGKNEVEAAAPTTKECPYCKSEINIDAVRCPHCTSEL
ncbi:MAG: large conductance mechanosensitive channel protein MscL [Clostridia bacterium]|nr:large conductance mechanosensitive channel protein MscL [Clostridia bacterium]